MITPKSKGNTGNIINYEEEVKKCRTQEDIFGENGLIKRLIKDVIENMLEAEMDEYFGRKKHERTGQEDPNYRNGYRQKPIRSSVGEFEVDIPRDRESEFKPQVVENYKAPRKQKRTAKKIYKDLKKKYHEEFKLSYRTVARYVSYRKKLLYSEDKGSIPLDHPGGEAQVDFGEAKFYENGMWYNGYYVAVSFPFSNGGYIQLFKGANMECLLEGLKNIFEHINRVPKCMWFDNDKTVVKKILAHGRREVTEGFLRFRMHYGFETNFCNPDAGREKGHIENKVGYTRRNFLSPVPRFRDIKEFNKQLLQWCDEDMQREHYKKDECICDLFKQELKAMNKLARNPFEICRLVKAKANNYGMVNFDNKRYSSSPQHAGRELWIKTDAFTVTVMDEEYNVIQKHDRLYGNRKESMEWGPYLNLMSRRPTALKYTEFFKKLPITLQDYLSRCEYEEKKEALKLIVKMLEEGEA